MAGSPAANDTSCNGVDNDCNGQVDEDYVPVATNCGAGACAATGPADAGAGWTATGATGVGGRARPPASGAAG
jgi:hypothetical protein